MSASSFCEQKLASAVDHRYISLKVPNSEFVLTVLIGQNLTSKSKWWVFIIVCKWVPNVKFNFDVCVDCRQCLTDISASNSTLGSFRDMCPQGCCQQVSAFVWMLKKIRLVIHSLSEKATIPDWLLGRCPKKDCWRCCAK